MKKYIKPAIEEIYLGAESQIMQVASEIRIVGTPSTDIGYIDPTGIDGDGVSGGDGNYGQWAPGKKGSSDEDFGW